MLVMFGSAASGKTHKGSDVDIGYEAKRPLTLNKDLSLRMELFYAFDKKEIDLVDMRKSSPLLMSEISRDGKILTGKESDFEDFKLLAFHSYNDYKPYFDLQHKNIKKFLAHAK